MKITKFEQSGFVIESDNGYRIAFDIGTYTPIENISKIGHIDAFFVSHIHGDHFSIDHIKAISPLKLFINSECMETLGEESMPFEIQIIKSGDMIAAGDFNLSFFDVDHGPNISSPLKENFGFLIEADSEKIYFPGDMFYESGIDVTNLEVEYALLPVGTFYTFGPEEAFKFAKRFRKIGKIISMHYEKTPQTRDQFIALAQKDFNVE